MLFHCDFYALFINPGYYDGASLGREQNVAIYWFCSAKSLTVKSIEADCLVGVETGDVDEASCRLDGDATLFHWFNTFGVFDSFNSSKVAPRFCCFISLDCRCRDVKCSINTPIIESIMIGWWNLLCVTIDVFYISTVSESLLTNTCNTKASLYSFVTYYSVGNNYYKLNIPYYIVKKILYYYYKGYIDFLTIFWWNRFV